MTSTDQLDLDTIEARANAATRCPEAEINGRMDGQHTWDDSSFASVQCELCHYTRPRGVRAEETAALVAEVRRLRADAADALLPDWEAMYEPGNVSNYLIGYANDEAAAKGAAEAWLRSQAEVTGRLEWESWGTVTDLPDGYDAWFELAERHDDGIDTGPGIVVRRRATHPAARSAAV